jgi:hypothetical protein
MHLLNLTPLTKPSQIPGFVPGIFHCPEMRCVRRDSPMKSYLTFAEYEHKWYSY